MKRKIMPTVILIGCLMAIAIYIAGGWQKNNYRSTTSNQDKTGLSFNTKEVIKNGVITDNKKTQKQQIIPKESSRNKSEFTTKNKTDKVHIDPRLKDIKVTGEVVEDPEQHLENDPERLETTIRLQQFTMPIKNLMMFFPSFAYEGKMELEIPTFTNRRDNYDGSTAKITSKFTLLKDEDGNFELSQESNSSNRKNTFSSPAYNGHYYYVDGETEYYTSSGEQYFDDKLSMIKTLLDKNNSEPLVRKKWIEIINDIEPVIDLELITEGENSITWNIIKRDGLDTNNQKIKITSLRGTVTARTSDNVVTQASFDGSGTYQEGFMKGATVSWKIDLNLSQIGIQGQIYLP